jgi:hypothetical protein
MSTTTDDLVALTRQTLDDALEPYLVPDDAITTALDRAQREFVERTLCLQVHARPASLVTGASLLWLDEDVLRVRSLTLDNRPLQLCSMREMNMGYIVRDYGLRTQASWQDAVGTPEVAITDAQDGALRLVPITTGDITLYLDAYVYPPLMSEGEDPAIPQQWRSDLVSGAMVHLLVTRNANVFDPKGAEVWRQTWHRALAEAYAGIHRGQRGAQTARFNRNGVW